MREHSEEKPVLLNYERVKADAVSANLYTQRRPGKHQFEMRMVGEAMALLPSGKVRTVLDAPCGVGRLSLWLGQLGYSVTAVDLGEAAVLYTQRLLASNDIPAKVSSQNIFALPYSEGEFDATICFRLLHHFESSADQQALIRELCRVSDDYVVISYMSPYSLTSLRRRWRRTVSGKPIKQHPNTLQSLVEMFAANGFCLRGSVKRSGFLHSLQVAVFESAKSAEKPFGQT